MGWLGVVPHPDATAVMHERLPIYQRRARDWRWIVPFAMFVGLIISLFVIFTR